MNTGQKGYTSDIGIIYIFSSKKKHQRENKEIKIEETYRIKNIFVSLFVANRILKVRNSCV